MLRRAVGAAGGPVEGREPVFEAAERQWDFEGGAMGLSDLFDVRLSVEIVPALGGISMNDSVEDKKSAEFLGVECA